MDNVSAGNQGNGYIYFTQGLVENGVTRRFLAKNLNDPTIAGGEATIDVGHVPVASFDRNVAYASGTGMTVRYLLRDATHDRQSYFQNSTFWNNTRGIDLPYTHRATLRNLNVIHSSGTQLRTSGIGMNVITRDINYENLNVVGYYRGIELPPGGYAVVNGGFYDNQFDFVVSTGTSNDHIVYITGPIQFGDSAGGANVQVYMRPTFNYYGGYLGYAFSRDLVILNYGPFQDQRVYYRLQAANSVPFPAAMGDLPLKYVGLTNQQLWDRYGVALGGAIAPTDAVTMPLIEGLVVPKS
jgi:hypothetical protein